jgi:flagella basal body P-ring formation protein FlgA
MAADGRAEAVRAARAASTFRRGGSVRRIRQHPAARAALSGARACGMLLANGSAMHRCPHQRLPVSRFLALAVLLAATTPAAAGAWQDADAIRAAAEAAARERAAQWPGRVAVAAESLDPRLRMPACEVPLAASLPASAAAAGRVSAEVRCTGARPWRLYVPVTISLTRTLVVAARPLERGRLLTPDDVILAERDVGAVTGGYLTELEDAVGRVMRRDAAAGAVLAPRLLDSPVIVRRGQPVTLEARSGKIRVQMAGVAQEDGARGETITVRNSSSHKDLEGIVRSEKVVEVVLP